MTNENPTVLVVDDDPDIRAALVDLVSEFGFRTVGAFDGVDALARIDEVHPDVVVLDNRMPRMTGTECVRELRSRGNDVPIVLMTAAREVEELARSIGVRWFIGKPFGVEQLVEAIRRALSSPAR